MPGIDQVEGLGTKMSQSRFSILIAACVLLFIGGQIQGQQQSLGLVPAMVDANVKRGLTYTQNFTIVNNTTTRLRFRCSVGDYWYDDHNGRLVGRPGTLPRSASTWVQFTPNELIIDAHGSATVNAIISVPGDASGGYYTIPFFEGSPLEPSSQQDGKANSTFGVRLGGLLMLATEGASDYNVEIKSAHLQLPTESSELQIQLDIHNRGNAHVRLRGLFAILDTTGKLVGRGRIEEKVFLPGQQNPMQAPWGDQLSPGHYTAIITLTYERAGTEPASLVYELPFDLK